MYIIIEVRWNLPIKNSLFRETWIIFGIGVNEKPYMGREGAGSSATKVLNWKNNLYLLEQGLNVCLFNSTLTFEMVKHPISLNTGSNLYMCIDFTVAWILSPCTEDSQWYIFRYRREKSIRDNVFGATFEMRKYLLCHQPPRSQANMVVSKGELPEPWTSKVFARLERFDNHNYGPSCWLRNCNGRRLVIVYECLSREATCARWIIMALVKYKVGAVIRYVNGWKGCPWYHEHGAVIFLYFLILEQHYQK